MECQSRWWYFSRGMIILQQKKLRIFHLEDFVNLFWCNRRITLAFDPSPPTSFASLRPASTTSYSAWLLVALNLKHKDCGKATLFNPSNMIPAPLPCRLEEPPPPLIWWWWVEFIHKIYQALCPDHSLRLILYLIFWQLYGQCHHPTGQFGFVQNSSKWTISLDNNPMSLEILLEASSNVDQCQNNLFHQLILSLWVL